MPLTESQWAERLEKLRANNDPFRNLEQFKDLATEDTTISSWEEFHAWCSPFKRAGCFRGQADSDWHLYPSFYRKVHQKWTFDTATSVDSVNPEENELAILKEFQHAAHHHYAVAPGLEEVVDWLALMQHHGAP